MSEISLPLLSQPSDCLIPRLKLKLSPTRLELLLGALRNEGNQVTELGLQTIDRLIYDHTMRPTAIALEAFQTTDTALAQAFSDVIEKSKDVRGKTERPTLKSVWQAQTFALSREDRLPPPVDSLRLIHRDDYPLLSLHGLCGRAVTSVPDTPWLLVSTDYASAANVRKVKPGHVCSLITLADDAAAKEAFADLISQRKTKSLIRKIRAVSPGEYLGAILDEAVGCDIDFFALTLATGRTLEELLPSLPEGYLVWTTARAAHRLSKRLAKIDAELTVFARAKRRPRLTFHYLRKEIFSCRLSSLRGVTVPCVIELRLPPALSRKESIAPSPVMKVGSYLAACRHLPADTATSPEDLSDWIATTLDTLVQAGGRREKSYIAVGVCENAQTPPSGLWSAALSLHEAQSKNDLMALEPQIHPCSHAPCGTTVCLISPLG